MSCVPIFRDVLRKTLMLNKASVSVLLHLVLRLHLHENNSGFRTFKNYQEMADSFGLSINTTKKAMGELELNEIVSIRKNSRHKTFTIKLNFERPSGYNTACHQGGYIKLPLADLFSFHLTGNALKVWAFNFLCTKGLFNKETKILNVWAQNDLALSRSSVTKANDELKSKGLQSFTVEKKTGHHIFILNKFQEKPKSEVVPKTLSPAIVKAQSHRAVQEAIQQKSEIEGEKSKSSASKSEIGHNYKDSSSSKKNSKNPSLKESSLAPIKEILQANGFIENQESLIDICVNELKEKGIITKNGRYVSCGDPLRYLSTQKEEHGSPTVIKVYQRYIQGSQKEKKEELENLSFDEMKTIYIQEMAGKEENFNLLLDSACINTSDECRIKSRLATNLVDSSNSMLNHIRKTKAVGKNQFIANQVKPVLVDQSIASAVFSEMIKQLGGVV